MGTGNTFISFGWKDIATAAGGRFILMAPAVAGGCRKYQSSQAKTGTAPLRYSCGPRDHVPVAQRRNVLYTYSL